MQTLTLEQVKKAAREYYAKGKLTAQHPEKAFRLCVYALAEDFSYRCAFGAALDDEHVKEAIISGGRVHRLIYENIVQLNLNEELMIYQIQGAHDNWATASTEESRKELEKKFLELVSE